MPIAPAHIFSAARLDPLYDERGVVTLDAAFVPGSSLARGTVIGQVTAAVNEVQTITVTATGGTFTISYTNPVTGITTTSAAIAYNANAATIQTAINGLVGASATTVTGTGPFVVTFSGTSVAGTNVPALVIDPTLATGGTVTIAQTTQGAPAGVFKAYASGNSDGSQTPKGILRYDVTVAADGTVSLGPNASQRGDVRTDAPYFIAGTFDTTLLTGLDANALSATGWRLVSGTLAAGVVRLG